MRNRNLTRGYLAGLLRGLLLSSSLSSPLPTNKSVVLLTNQKDYEHFNQLRERECGIGC
jgi:hypothetical protein